MSRFPYARQFDGSVNTPMDYAYDYKSGESSSSARNHTSSSHHLPSDLPDLYYDYGGLPTPPSATSSNMICTPPQDWQSLWQPTLAKSSTNRERHLTSTWPISPMQVARPTVAPIDTNSNWAYHQYPGADHTYASSELFAGYDDKGQSHKPTSQGLLLTQPVTGFNLASSSPLPETVSPAALSNRSTSTSPAYPPLIGQTPVKLHQPRPSRRIPIVSLDRLASACEDSTITLRRTRSSKDTLSPLPLDLGYSYHSSSHPHHHPSFQQQRFHPYNNSYNNSSISRPSNHEMEKAIVCTCGCMESYTFRQ